MRKCSLPPTTSLDWVQNWGDAEKAAAQLLTARPGSPRRCGTEAEARAAARRILLDEGVQQQPAAAEGGGGAGEQPYGAIQPKETAAPPAQPEPEYGFCERSHRRLVNIFNNYEPARLPQVVSILLQFHGHEESVIGACLRKAGPEPGARGGPPAPLDLPLEDGWREVRGRRGHLYYRHSDGRKQWARPIAPGAAQQQPTAAAEPPPADQSFAPHSPTGERDKAAEVRALREMMQQIPGIPTYDDPEPPQPVPQQQQQAASYGQTVGMSLSAQKLANMGEQMLQDGMAQSTWVQ